jgi:hypothetical protein
MMEAQQEHNSRLCRPPIGTVTTGTSQAFDEGKRLCLLGLVGGGFSPLH